MKFKSYDSLRIFDVVARKMSITRAAEELNLTKGAVSYKIKRLELDLGFPVFLRQAGGIELTEQGKLLWHASQLNLQRLDDEISQIRMKDRQQITIGMSTYFASRWLSPRLMRFTSAFPEVGLRLQPTVGLFDIQKKGIDMIVRWGTGGWRDLSVVKLFNCPAIPTGGKIICNQIDEKGLEQVMREVTLLHDYEGSSAWHDWHDAAGLTYLPKQSDLVIPDPNVRVQAVADGQGVALNDFLVNDEIANGNIHQISSVTLANYGYYLAYHQSVLGNPAIESFHDWVISEASAPN